MRFSGPKTSIIRTPTTSLKTSIKTITNLSDTNCLEIHGASLKNKDGSIDLWFGPSKPDGVADSAFIKTVPDRNFLVALRLYGTEDGFYDQTWVPDDLIQTNK
ncbi:DUF1214 domain-containing protein [Klebsiella quasipneumoniae]|uniref:DUF1214 domain-containing protein n=1 Tax=Klebsiella quasipneumoniae TaxID=1463165 RepID=UPI003FA5EA41